MSVWAGMDPKFRRQEEREGHSADEPFHMATRHTPMDPPRPLRPPPIPPEPDDRDPALIALLQTAYLRHPPRPALPEPIIFPTDDAGGDSDSDVQEIPPPRQGHIIPAQPQSIVVIHQPDSYAISRITEVSIACHYYNRSRAANRRFEFDGVKWTVTWDPEGTWLDSELSTYSFDDPLLVCDLSMLFKRLKDSGRARWQAWTERFFHWVPPAHDPIRLFIQQDEATTWYVTIPLSRGLLDTWGVPWQDLSAIVDAELLPY